MKCFHALFSFYKLHRTAKLNRTLPAITRLRINECYEAIEAQMNNKKILIRYIISYFKVLRFAY